MNSPSNIKISISTCGKLDPCAENVQIHNYVPKLMYPIYLNYDNLTLLNPISPNTRERTSPHPTSADR